MYAAKQPAAQYGMYQQQSAMTASPGELTLMLYDGCIKFLKQARLYMEERNIEKSSNACVRAEDILAELMATLDMRYEMSEGLYNLYDFMLREITKANLKKDKDLLDAPISMMSELRETWQQAIKMNRAQNAGQGGIYE